MDTQLVLTLIAPDRTGIVEAVAREVSRFGGNWTSSSMARLAGRFAGILEVIVPEEQRSALLTALEALHAEGIRVLADPAVVAAADAPHRTLSLSLVATDRPGLVRAISRVIADQGGNVEYLSTSVAPAPMTGESLFQAQLQVSLPSELALSKLRDELEALANDLMVDLRLEG